MEQPVPYYRHSILCKCQVIMTKTEQKKTFQLATSVRKRKSEPDFLIVDTLKIPPNVL